MSIFILGTMIHIHPNMFQIYSMIPLNLEGLETSTQMHIEEHNLFFNGTNSHLRCTTTGRTVAYQIFQHFPTAKKKHVHIGWETQQEKGMYGQHPQNI
jgi:hypothetical protein